jgi:hypothetical protein
MATNRVWVASPDIGIAAEAPAAAPEKNNFMESQYAAILLRIKRYISA